MKILQDRRKRRTVCWAAAGFSILALGAVLFWITGDTGYRVTTFSMGSYVQQTVYGRGREEAARLAANRAAELEDLISWRKENSDVFRLNAAAGDSFVEIDAVTEKLLTEARDLYQASGGAFDVTIAPISRLWDFDDSPQVPDPDLLETFRRKVDGAALALPGDGTAALQKADMALDLGAIGKGAACDAAVEAYRETGVQRAVVMVGGSVGVYGKKPFGESWTVAVRDPESQGSMGLLKIEEGFVSTSGSYEKRFEKAGKVYHHLLDPATGYPAESGLVGVTVWSGSGALSDGLSTACFVLGAEKSLPLLEQYGAQALFITEDSRVLLTAGLAERFTLTSAQYVQEVLP